MASKKEIRRRFREAVWGRDNYQCVFCGQHGGLDAHHITDRNEMPNGGYVLENGITLCELHHEMAEAFHRNIEPEPGFWPHELYNKINSSYEEAYHASSNIRH